MLLYDTVINYRTSFAVLLSRTPSTSACFPEPKGRSAVSEFLRRVSELCDVESFVARTSPSDGRAAPRQPLGPSPISGQESGRLCLDQHINEIIINIQILMHPGPRRIRSPRRRGRTRRERPLGVAVGLPGLLQTAVGGGAPRDPLLTTGEALRCPEAGLARWEHTRSHAR